MEFCEKRDVLDTYSIIARKFSDTRYKIWPCTDAFIKMIPEEQNILEVGCGNGKNLIRSNMHGIDNCPEFIEICKEKGLQASIGDANNIPFPDNFYDNTMSIAVIHHLTTHERRKHAVQEMVRVTKSGGLIFVLVWAMDTDDEVNKKKKFTQQDNIIEFQGVGRYYHLFIKGELESLIPHNTEIITKIYEKGNFGIIIKKQ